MIPPFLRFLPLTAAVLLATGPAKAARPTTHLAGADHGGLVLADGRPTARRGRLSHATTQAGRGSNTAALRGLRAAFGPSWALIDDSTGIPRRVLTAGVPAADTIVDPWVAAQTAKQLLADHLEALAPGADRSDFVLVSNHLSAGMRSVGFAQYDRGREVIGGQLSFRFRHDKLVGIGSEALPHVDAPAPTRRIALAEAAEAARLWIDAEIDGALQRADPATGPFVLPIVDPDTHRTSYAEVFAVDVRLAHPASAWRVYIDTTTGAPVARQQTLSFASGVVSYQVPVRSPSFGPRANYPATFTDVLVDGAPQRSDAAGVVNFHGETGAIQTGLTGPLHTLLNAAGEPATNLLYVGDGGTTVWLAGDDEQVDAQLTAYIHAAVVKEYARGLDPTLGWLDEQLQITVNIADECNAYSDGDTINFFLASDTCENTGRMTDVIYHEFGHSLHHQSIIEGVGAFDGALSEGVSDYLSATITGDPAMARGFFYDEAPLRELDPEGVGAHWPEDAGEVHSAGLIIGQTLWDLRKLMVAKHGEAGVSITDRIYYEATRRSVDMSSMHSEALLIDDDDGDLSNGTPNGCEINAAFGEHGLYSPGKGAETVTVTPDATGYRVELALAVPQFPGCPVSTSATLESRVRGSDAVTVVDMGATPAGFTGVFPATASGQVIQYRARVNYSLGTQQNLPDNRADPWYEIYDGPVETLYCDSFAGPEASMWTGPGFSIGAPAGTSPVDPPTGYDADGRVLGHSLGGDGLYAPWSSDVMHSGPIRIDPTGHAAIRLQYWRWLTVEDGFFDTATLAVDGETLWSNFAGDDEDDSTTHHTDREWRFHDLDITAQAGDGEVELSFGIDSDGGLEMGGWTVDALCIVGVREQAPVCGNAFLEGAEQCDDGNLVDGDGCNRACIPEPPPVDGGEQDGDDDPGADDGDADPVGGNGLRDRGCACTLQGGATPGPAAGFGLLALWRLRRRKRHRRCGARDHRLNNGG